MAVRCDGAAAQSSGNIGLIPSSQRSWSRSGLMRLSNYRQYREKRETNASEQPRRRGDTGCDDRVTSAISGGRAEGHSACFPGPRSHHWN
jgi:hypothetical protein